MKICPDCSADLVDSATRCSCGWKAPAQASDGPPDDRHRCANEDRGLRCAELGSLSPSTVGGGPWFCWNHAKFIHGGNPGSYVPIRRERTPQTDFEELRSLTKSVVPIRPLDVEAELERAALRGDA